MLPVMHRIAGDTYVFQQDSAPAHRARDTVQLLQQKTPEFIAPDLWPPNSPDLNPVDYRVWGLMQERVYKTAVRGTADLKQHLLETWSGIPRTVIYEVIDEWATNTMRQSKGTSLRAVAVTSRLLSEPPNATTVFFVFMKKIWRFPKNETCVIE